MIEYSVVVPVYNEEDSLPVLFTEINAVMRTLKQPYEIIFIDDCSSDRSPEILNAFKKQLSESVQIIRLKERSGQTFAMRKGLDAIRGNIAVTMDADLQNDPADIPRLIEKMKEGYDVVCGWRKSRQDRPLKMALSKFGNVLQRVISGFKVHDVSCTLRAYKKECAAKVPLNWEGQHRFIPLSLHLQGFRIGEIVSNHRQRQFGYSKYSHKRIFRVIGDFFRILAAGGKK